MNVVKLLTAFTILLTGCAAPLTNQAATAPLPAPECITVQLDITPTGTPPPTPVSTLTSPPTATASPTLYEPIIIHSATPIPAATPLVFAVIGDYGGAGQVEADVAQLVKSWNPEFIVTTGDNNYPDGAADTIDANIGQYYHDFIYPYDGEYGAGADENRFFPTLGNHDWYTAGAQPYLDYFTLPGNERYYDVVWEPVHLFALDGDPNEPGGVSSDSLQATWLQAVLAASTQPWKLVVVHQPPYSSGQHGSTEWMQWPFAAWGASAALSGHDHTYERIVLDGFPYFVNGLGGYPSRYPFLFTVPGSAVRYNDDWGAMRMEATETTITFQFITRAGEVIDTYALEK